MQLRFTKMHGLGNDFVVIDSLSQDIRLNSQHVRAIADRKLGVGCDQLLLIEPPLEPEVDFNYRIFNADGSEVEQCGNGARCLGKYVSDKRLTGKSSICVSTANSRMQINIIDAEQVQVDMGAPRLEPENIPFRASQKQLVYSISHSLGEDEISAVSMGNPHAVLLVDDINNAPVADKGPVIEHHEQFPERVNVGFMQVLSPQAVRLRVFERGVGETLACGTGACAAVVAGQLRGLLEQEVEVTLNGGKLRICWHGEGSPVMMTGPASKVFDGKIKL